MLITISLNTYGAGLISAEHFSAQWMVSTAIGLINTTQKACTIQTGSLQMNQQDYTLHHVHWLGDPPPDLSEVGQYGTSPAACPGTGLSPTETPCSPCRLTSMHRQAGWHASPAVPASPLQDWPAVNSDIQLLESDVKLRPDLVKCFQMTFAGLHVHEWIDGHRRGQGRSPPGPPPPPCPLLYWLEPHESLG